MRFKSTIESILRFCPPLYRFGSRFYHRMNPEFKTLSPGAPQAIKNAFDLIKTDPDASQFEGDYYEFGLFRGGTFLATSQILKGNGQNAVHLYGFDSFEGLPAAEDVDTIDTRFFEGQFACSREEVVKNLEQHGMDMARATLIEGYYEDSLTPQLHDQYPFKPADPSLESFSTTLSFSIFSGVGCTSQHKPPAMHLEVLKELDTKFRVCLKPFL